MKTLISLVLILTFSSLALAHIQRVEPSNWWAGMSHPELQFLYLSIDSNHTPGMLAIVLFENGIQVHTIDYPLLEREPGAALRKGFDSSDVMYLLMPDRFSNGDLSNDRNAGMREKTINRNDPYGRHGGDLQGIIQNLDMPRFFMARFSHDFNGQTTAWDVIREKNTSLTGTLSLTPKQPYILTWTKQ